MGVPKMAKLIYKLLIVLGAIKIINSKIINYETYCPSGYNRIPNTRICILITTKTEPYKNICLSSGQTNTYYYESIFHHRDSQHIIEYIQLSGVSSVWLPIRKNLQQILVWKLPLPKWNKRVNNVNGTNAPLNYELGDCVVFMVDDDEMKMENCEILHKHICIFDQSDTKYVVTDLCYNTTVTSRLSTLHGICFDVDKLNLTSPINKSIAVIESDDKLVAVDQFIAFRELQNIKIQISTNFISNIPPGYVTVLESSVVKLVDKQFVLYKVVEQNIAERIHNYRVTIQIFHDSNTNALIANIRNYQFLWTIDIREFPPIQCFTDANLKTDILSSVSVHTKEIARNLHVEMRLPWEIGIGNYWCEGQKLATFETIESNRLLVINQYSFDTYILCVYVLKSCPECNFYSVVDNFIWDKSSDYFQYQGYFIRDNQSHQFQYQGNLLKYVQLKKIISIHNDNMEMLLHAHIFRYAGLDYADNLQFDQKLLKDQLSGYNVTEVRATDTCFSQDLNYFPNAKINEISVFKKFCLMNTGLPAVQKCIGNQFDGAFWERVYNITTIFKNCDASLVNKQTKELFELNEKLRALNETSQHDNNAKEIIERAIGAINRVITMENKKLSEIHYAAITLNNLFENSQFDVFDVMDDANPTNILDSVTDIIKTLIERETHPLVQDANRILETIDSLAMKYAESPATKQLFLDPDDGVILIQKSNIILMIVNPAITNITGIALYKKTKNDIDLNDFTVRKLYGHEKAVNIYNKSLELSAQIPTKWLFRLQIDQNGHMILPNRIIFKIFYKHSLFDETHVDPESGDITETVDTDSKIISVSVSNYTGFESTHGLFAMFRTKLDMRRSNPHCLGCSDFSATAGSFVKRWNRDLTKFDQLDDNIVLCPMNRLSNIGFVKLLGNKTDKRPRIFSTISHYTTIIGCTLSLFGLTIIFLTALLFDKWKRREATPLVLNISVATFLQITMFAVAESHIFTSSINCLIVGGILHYVTLVSFFISLFVADSQYRRYILILSSAITEWLKIKIFLVGWLVPFLIVAVCIIAQPDAYIPSDEFCLDGICYPTNIILYCSVHLPIVVMLCINFSVYGWIVYKLTGEDPTLRKTPRKSIIVAQIRLFFFIFMVLSLPWICGLLAYYTEFYAFSFLFELLASLQGFSLFVFCCLVDAQTKKFWLEWKMCKKVT